MSISIDLGNFWEMLSAIGTIAAVVVALIFSNKKNNKPIKLTLLTSTIGYGYEYFDNGVNNEIGVDLNNPEEENSANLLDLDGRMCFYNPSDDPKTLINMEIEATFGTEKKFTTTYPFQQSEKQYIALSPKETRVIDFRLRIRKKDFPDYETIIFEKIKEFSLTATDEEGKYTRFAMLSNIGIEKA